MADTVRQGVRWEDLPADEQQEGYWLAVSEKQRVCWGDLDYEIVYVCGDDLGRIVWVVGIEDGESARHWRFLRRLDLPASAADVMAPVAQAAETEVRKRLEAAVGWSMVDGTCHLFRTADGLRDHILQRQKDAKNSLHVCWVDRVELHL